MPRRYYAFYEYRFLQPIAEQHVFITFAAFVLGVAQLLFLFNFIWSLRKGDRASDNPWDAPTLEWTTPSPPPHGNWPDAVPHVYRGPYDYGTPELNRDYAPQSLPALAGDSTAGARQ
jgi:cytochrome c oxidase subunit 1